MSVKLEFKAGKMLSENSKVRPDMRKGKIQIVADESEISHFQWVDPEGKVEDDYIIFPGEFKFSKVVQTKSRVYLLEFGDDKFFYWLQEPNADLDKELCEKVNKVIGNEPKLEEKKIDTSALARVLESLAKPQLIPDLDEILTPEILKNLVDNLSKYSELLDLLPEEQKSADYLRDNLISAQLQQALQILSGAIRSPGGPAIFSSLGLQGFDSGNSSDPLERLLRAIQSKSDIRKGRK